MTQILNYSLAPVRHFVKRFWLKRKLSACQKGADVSEALADAERRNAAYFRKRAVQIAHELRRMQ